MLVVRLQFRFRVTTTIQEPTYRLYPEIHRMIVIPILHVNLALASDALLELTTTYMTHVHAWRF